MTIGFGSGISKEFSGSATIGVQMPPGIVVGSVLIVNLSWASNINVSAVPTGWQLEASATQAAAASHCFVYSKVAVAGDSLATYNWTMSAAVNLVSNAQEFTAAGTIRSLTSNTTTSTVASSSTTYVVPNINSLGDKEMAVAMTTFDAFTSATSSPPSWTPLTSQIHSTFALGTQMDGFLNTGTRGTITGGNGTTGSLSNSRAIVVIAIKDKWVLEGQPPMQQRLNTLLRR